MVRIGEKHKIMVLGSKVQLEKQAIKGCDVHEMGIDHPNKESLI